MAYFYSVVFWSVSWPNWYNYDYVTANDFDYKSTEFIHFNRKQHSRYWHFISWMTKRMTKVQRIKTHSIAQIIKTNGHFKNGIKWSQTEEKICQAAKSTIIWFSLTFGLLDNTFQLKHLNWLRNMKEKQKFNAQSIQLDWHLVHFMFVTFQFKFEWCSPV